MVSSYTPGRVRRRVFGRFHLSVAVNVFLLLAVLRLRLQAHPTSIPSLFPQGVFTCASERPWLVIGIPTVPRRNGTSYLRRTLESLMEELPSPLSGDVLTGQVRVLVMNMAGARPHEEWSALRRAAGADGPHPDAPPVESSLPSTESKLSHYAHFLRNERPLRDPHPEAPDPDDLHNPEDRPGHEVRRQTLDLVSLLAAAAALRPRYYLFMEDDFETCPLALRALQLAAARADAEPAARGWAALRASYGMNGVLLQGEALEALAAFLARNVMRLPPDLLWIEWIRRVPRDWRGGKQEALAGPGGGGPLAVARRLAAGWGRAGLDTLGEGREEEREERRGGGEQGPAQLAEKRRGEQEALHPEEQRAGADSSTSILPRLDASEVWAQAVWRGRRRGEEEGAAAPRLPRGDVEAEPLLELKERAPYAVYRHNLFAHVGAVSSFAVRPDRHEWPRCFASLSSAWSLQDVEKYHAACSGVSDISPCDHDALPEERWARLRVDWGGQVPLSRAQRVSERRKHAEHRHGG